MDFLNQLKGNVFTQKGGSRLKNLQKTVKWLKKDHATIDENLLKIMEDQEKAAKSEKRRSLSLSHQTRKFRLESLLQVLDLTRESVENFFDDYDVIDKTPEGVIETFSENVLQQAQKLHDYCKTSLQNISELDREDAGKVEDCIGEIHDCLEALLESLVEAGKKLHEHDAVEVPEEPVHDRHRVQDPDLAVVTGKVMSTAARELVPTKKLNFADVQTSVNVENQKQLTMGEQMYAESLLAKLPLKY